MHFRQVAPIRHCGHDPQSYSQQMIVFERFRIKCGMTHNYLLEVHKQLKYNPENEIVCFSACY
jgi:hypothetical protein